MVPSPIALFVYNRLEHVNRTVDALKRNNLAAQSKLVVFSDGPRSAADVGKVAAVRDAIRAIDGFQSVEVVPRSENVGLARSIIDGVTSVVSTFGTVVVIEDDLITSRHFLHFMNDGLATYRDTPEVVSVSGYAFPCAEPRPDTFFLRGAECWGWATWKRGWDLFRSDGSALLKELRRRKLIREFDLDDHYGYSEMLRKQIRHKNDSWAIRWHASAFLAGKFTLFPGRSLVKNIGLDGSGTHCPATNQHDVDLDDRPITITRTHVASDPRVESLYRAQMRGVGLVAAAKCAYRRAHRQLHSLIDFV